MRWVLAMGSLVAAACGSVNERAGCRAASDCAVGQYCAATPDGNVCWADATPPSVQLVSAACADGCKRDGILQVVAAAADPDSGLLGVTATLALPGATQDVALSPTGGGQYAGQLALATVPFPFFEASGSVTVTAQNGARIAASTAAQPGIAITRLRWTVPVSPDGVVVPTAPAVQADGTAVVGATDGKLYFVALDRTRPLTVGPFAPIMQPPSIGATAVWVAAGTVVYALSPSDGSKLNGDAGCDMGAAAVGPPAVAAASTVETVIASATSGRAWAAAASTLSGYCSQSSSIGRAFVSGPVLDKLGHVLAISSDATDAYVNQLAFDGGFNSLGEIRIGASAVGAPALDASNATWAATADGARSTLSRMIPSRTLDVTAGLNASASASAVITPSGDVLVSEGSAVARFASSGTPTWSAPQLSGIGLTPMVLAGGDATFIVPTKAGTIHAISDAGQELWSHALAAVELREGNIHSPPGAPVSTAYFTSVDGKLHAVIVDGHLDASAPWPKAWHDPRNTSNAATPF